MYAPNLLTHQLEPIEAASTFPPIKGEDRAMIG